MFSGAMVRKAMPKGMVRSPFSQRTEMFPHMPWFILRQSITRQVLAIRLRNKNSMSFTWKT
jgi:hypothetical protein